MSVDMGIKKFANEKEEIFKSRIIYSGIAQWMKAFVLQEEINRTDKKGISKNSLTLQSKVIYQEMLNRFPECKLWFDPKNKEEALLLIEKQLMMSGELLQCGSESESRWAMPYAQTQILRDGIGRRLGVNVDGLNKNYCVSGIATIQLFQSPLFEKKIEVDSYEWAITHFKQLKFHSNSYSSSRIEYFNPFVSYNRIKLHWQENRPDIDNLPFLCCRIVRENHYDLFLEKNDEDREISSIIIKDNPLYPELLRFFYAQCEHVHNPFKYHCVESGDSVEFQCPTKLPFSTEAIVHAIGWPLRNISDLHYIYPKKVWPAVEKELTRLGMRKV